MEREANDVSEDLTPDELSEMEERRIDRLNEAGVDEHVVLTQAHKHLNTWNSYFQENITRGKDDQNFVIRDQWTAIERSEFTRLFKPAMTFNKLYDTTKKIVGEQRKNKPDLIVRSLTGRASQQQIDLRADLVRTIAYKSQNDLVYQTAFKSALLMGFGAFQICLDYESPESFNQMPYYDLIPDPTRCAWDPTALKPHKGDGNYCSRSYLFTREEFFATYPYITNPVSYIDPYMLLDFQWNTRDTVIVNDYFNKEWFPLIVYKLSNGQSMSKEKWEDLEKKLHHQEEITEGAIVADIMRRDRPRIVAERQSQDYRVMHYRMLRDQIIDFSEWPSKQLPIIFVDGDSSYIEGRQYLKSFVHEARDAQKCVNYINSEIIAEIKNRRREQWLGTPDNIIGYEQDWRNPEVQMGMLKARPDPKTGAMPQKMPAWELSQGLLVNSQRATQDIKEILGFSESEELQGRDISGKARRERKVEGSMSAEVFLDNLAQAVEQGGRVVNDLLPFIAGEDERYMTLSKKDGRSESIILNHKQPDGTLKNQIEKGDFDVEIDSGPSFAVQKDMALEFLQQTLQAFPQAFPLVADLYAKNLDVQFSEQIAERFQSLVPPEILAKEQGKPPPPPKPDPQAQMMQAEIEEKKEAIRLKGEELKLKAEKLELEKAELQLKAQKDQLDAHLNVFDHKANIKQAEITHRLDHHKSELDFTHKMASLLSDVHKHESQQKHDKEINSMKVKEKPTKI